MTSTTYPSVTLAATCISAFLGIPAVQVGRVPNPDPKWRVPWTVRRFAMLPVFGVSIEHLQILRRQGIPAEPFDVMAFFGDTAAPANAHG